MTTYNIYQKDLDATLRDLLLEQYRNAPVAASIADGINQQNTQLYNAIIDGLENRSLSNAIGAQLDVLGAIVGQERILENFASKNWFTCDHNAQGVDGGLTWVHGAPIGGDLPVDDFQYRQLIFAKIFKNHVKYGSIPEIKQFVRLLYDISISIRQEGLSDLTLIVPASTPQYLLEQLMSYDDNLQTDKHYFLPIPSTGRLLGCIRKPDNAFACDRPHSGSDQGKSALLIPSNAF